MTVDKFFDTVDAIALRLRVYAKSLFWVLIAVNGMIASGYFPIKTGTVWAHAAALLTALVGYFTVRSSKQASDLKEVARVGGSATMARIPTPGLGAIPTVSSEAITPQPFRRDKP